MKLLDRLIALAGALAATGVYARWIEPHWLRITRLKVPLPNLPPAFDGYRIVQLSDIHLGVPLTQRHLLPVIQAANRERPDLFVMTGDLATARRNETDAAAGILARLDAPDGAWAILGNHDYAPGPRHIEALLNAADIRLLVNDHHMLQRGSDRLALAGIDDAMRGMPNLCAALTGVPDQVPVILLAHEPDFAYTAAGDSRVALQLSGHTHGGQVRLPGLGALILPRLGHAFPVGLHRVHHLTLYVTTGVGTGYFALRFNCRPEIAVITLVRGPREWLPPRNHGIV